MKAIPITPRTSGRSSPGRAPAWRTSPSASLLRSSTFCSRHCWTPPRSTRAAAQLEKLSGPSTRYEGLALISVGITVLVVAAVRFVRTERSLADPRFHPPSAASAEVILSAVLALIVAGLGALLALAG